jgi:hypothetical protein
MTSKPTHCPHFTVNSRRSLKVGCFPVIRIYLVWGQSGATEFCGSHYTRFRYPRFRISGVLFKYHEEHQYPIRGQILKPITCVEPSPRLSGNVMQMISESSKNSGASLTSKWWLLHVYRLTRFRYTRRFAGTRPPRITRVARSLLLLLLLINQYGYCGLHRSICVPRKVVKKRIKILV